MKGPCGCACVILALSSKHVLGSSCVPGARLGVGDLKVNRPRPYPHNSVEQGAFSFSVREVMGGPLTPVESEKASGESYQPG